MPRLEETTGRKTAPRSCASRLSALAVQRPPHFDSASHVILQETGGRRCATDEKVLVRGNGRQASPWTSGFTRKWAWFRTRTSANGKDSALASQRVKIELERKLLDEIPARKHQEWSISSRFSAGKALVRGNGRQASIEGEDSALARQDVKIGSEETSRNYSEYSR